MTAAHVAIHVDLVADGVAGAAVAVAAGVAVLGDEVGHDAVKARAVEVAGLHEPEIVGDGEGRVGGEELELDGALLVHLDEDVREAIGTQRQHEAPHDVAVVLRGAAGADGRDRPPRGGDVGPVVLRPGAQQVVALAGERLDEIGLHGGAAGDGPLEMASSASSAATAASVAESVWAWRNITVRAGTSAGLARAQPAPARRRRAP